MPELPRGARKVHQQGSTFHVIGDERRPLRDAYHWLLKARWPAFLAVIALAFLAANVGFAGLFMLAGGVEGSTGSFSDSLSFSVQTMATIGYGVMHPVAAPAHAIVIGESMFAIVFSALATGLVFAKFSRATARIAFSTVGHSSAASTCPASCTATTSASPSASVGLRLRGPAMASR